VEDLADVLAYHYATALDLTRAAGEADRTAELEAPARRFLTLAGERALGLDTPAALTNLERALALTPPTHPDRPEALVRFAEAAFHAGRTFEAKEALEQAIPSFQARGDLPAVAHAMHVLASLLARLADPRWFELPGEALALLEPLPKGPAHVEALTEVARADFLNGGSETALASAQRALTLANELGLEQSPRTLGYLGFARARLGDPRGLDDIREAIRLATAGGQGREVGVLHNNLGIQLWAYEGPRAALDEFDTGIAFASTCGLTEMLDLVTLSRIDPLIDAGRINEALEVATGLAARLEVEAPGDLVDIRSAQTRIHTLRGTAAQVAGWLDWLERSAREVGHTDSLVAGLASAGTAHAALGHAESAATLLEEIAATPATRETEYYTAYLPALVRSAVTLGDHALAQRLITGAETRTRYAEHSLIAATAVIAESTGDVPGAAEGYAAAAERWEQFGVMPEHAYALLSHGRCLINLGRPQEAAPILYPARALFDQLGAIPALAETDALLEQATALSS
jgi:tetratricopeptide (TPR) repeat protein